MAGEVGTMSQTVRDALNDYFAKNPFDASSYTSDSFTVPLFGRTCTIPNPPPRQKAIRLHDINHLVSGYNTDLKGEAEIAAFEMGAGTGAYPAAKFFNTTAFVMGLFLFPLKTLRAYARGVACKGSLYRLVPKGNEAAYFDLLDRRLSVVTLALGVPAEGSHRVVLPVLLRIPLVILYAAVGLLLWPLIILSFAFAFLRGE